MTRLASLRCVRVTSADAFVEPGEAVEPHAVGFEYLEVELRTVHRRRLVELVGDVDPDPVAVREVQQEACRGW